MDDPLGDMEEHMRAARRQHALAFGHRPEGDEHRAWVDHALLAATEPQSSDWERALSFLGLADLSGEALPDGIRQLQRVPTDATVTPILAATVALAYVVALGVFLGFGFVLTTALSSAILPGLVAGIVISTLFGEHVQAGWARVFGRPMSGTPEARKIRALAALRATPFVVVVEGRLIENLPTLSRFEGWLRDLESERSDARDRISDLETLRDRMHEVRGDLGERGSDAHIEAIRDTLRRERTLIERVDAVLSRVEARAAEIHAELEELRRRVELEALRSRTRDLTGAEGDLAPLRIAAELELDVHDLGTEVASLKHDLHEERLQARAVTEVGGLTA